MLKIKLLCIFITAATLVQAQSDFLLLKKHNKTLERFYTGSYISFQLDSKQWIDAYIKKIADDTLYLDPFEQIHAINAWGMPTVDTAWKNSFKVPINRIYAFPLAEHSVEFIRNGRILQIGGAGYILLNVINTLSSGDKLFDDNNGVRLAIAAGVFAIGTIMHVTHSHVLVLGKKYRLQYVKFNASS